MLELLISISLSTIIMLTVFDLYVCASHLSNQLSALADLQDRMQFLSFLFRRKIQFAGDMSCESQISNPNEPVIEILNSNEANIKFGVSAKSNTSVLKLKECVRAHDQLRYLPIIFYIKNTDDKHDNRKNIYSLYYKIGDLPSEELIPNMMEFEASHTGASVHIQYVLSSSNSVFPFTKKYYFHGQWITPSDHRFYQTGFLDAAIRKNLLITNKQNGFILPIVCILLFVLTMMVTSLTELLITTTKNQHMMHSQEEVFYRAEAGIIQIERELMQKPIVLPDSPIHLSAVVYQHSIDSCENKTIDIESTANWHHQYVKLRTRDIFARVPVLKGCTIVPVFQRIWWQQNTKRNEHETLT